MTENGILTTPLSVREVYSLLGVKPRSNGYDVGFICKNDHGKINEDALFKPYEADTVTNPKFLTGGPDGFYGYNIPVTTNSNVADLWRETWSWKSYPTTYYRLGDFQNYNHEVKYDDNPFEFTFEQAGSAWVVEYKNPIIEGLVSPANMECFKNYYPAFQVFETGTPSSIPATTSVFTWVGANTVGSGNSSGDYLYSLNMEDNKTYYIIPFLSQYRPSFLGDTNYYEGDPGTFTGNKYCLIYKDFLTSQWTFSTDGGGSDECTETMYSLKWVGFSYSDYAGTVTVSVSTECKNISGAIYGGFRIYDEVDGVESLWYDGGYDNTPSTISSSFTATPDGETSLYYTFSWGGTALTSNAKRVEVRLYDPTHSTRWSHEYSF